MTQSKKKVNWSELCPEMVRCVFERLSFTCLKRGRSVCSSWRTALRGCVPKRNQIPWLILFPRKNNNNRSSSCVLFVPEDRDNAYRTRDLGADFVKSSCVATYGSWLLMLDTRWNLTILNPLTGERIDLPTTDYARYQRYQRLDDIKPRDLVACLWIDDRSKDYLVVCKMDNLIFTKKGNHSWRSISSGKGLYKQMVYEHTSQKLYARSYYNILVHVWSFSGDEPQQVSEELYLNEEEFNLQDYVDSRVYIAVSTVSGQVLKVANLLHKSKRWLFHVYKMHAVELTWEVVDSLGDEALIIDMGITVVAKDVPGIKRNSIYFSGLHNGNSNPDRIFVFDLTTHEIEPLPQCVLSSIRFSDARWFFPGLDV
ncbi:F-box protein [Raphanus sativus]|uniref:F-box protein At2g05970-like n=1 Tax=Raphanus sativus TaxID=3726 RepID=A0A6J0MP13_RAPSA|nr:F-box protein At2g05970-like [Raphanus sativus]XP_056861086.1 F-box protein At2g05970-like [Raphanus sativus]KAJ4867891.1 F-box protein [Raphanus sativus]KAJ4907869.1 F-box protein [Raphanus sativus]